MDSTIENYIEKHLSEKNPRWMPCMGVSPDDLEDLILPELSDLQSGGIVLSYIPHYGNGRDGRKLDAIIVKYVDDADT